LNSPGSFQRYVASSPSAFWDDHAPAREAATIGKRAGRVPAHLFVSAGALETKEPWART
jgi:predicted alpha/beta superfamily hydrolase